MSSRVWRVSDMREPPRGLERLYRAAGRGPLKRAQPETARARKARSPATESLVSAVATGIQIATCPASAGGPIRRTGRAR